MGADTRHREKGRRINAHQLSTALAHPKGAENEERGLAACRRSYSNMIANMGKGKHISMETLLRICESLECGIDDVIELVDEKNPIPEKEHI